MAIVKSKTLQRSESYELLKMFKLPCVDYSNYQVKPRPEPVLLAVRPLT